MVVYHLHGWIGLLTVWAKFRTGKFRSGIAFINCTNRLKPEAGIKDGFETTELEFPFGTLCPEKQDFSDVPLLPKIIRWNDPNSPITFTFLPDFSGNVFQMVNNQYQSRKRVNK